MHFGKAISRDEPGVDFLECCVMAALIAAIALLVIFSDPYGICTRVEAALRQVIGVLSPR